MSFVVAAPDLVTDAAASLENLGATIHAANAAAAVSTTGMLAAGADEVSASITSLFAQHGLTYQALSTQATAFHDQFVQSLTGAASRYAVAEAANAGVLQTFEQEVLRVINAPTELLLGRPLIGDGATGRAYPLGVGGAGGTIADQRAAQ